MGTIRLEMTGGMNYRYVVSFPDGRRMAVFEEEEDPLTHEVHLVTTFCDASVSAQKHAELENQAVADWLRQIR